MAANKKDKIVQIDHPDYYGGEGNPLEVINIVEHWQLGFHLGNCVKYIFRAGNKKGEETIVALKKAQWYLARKIEQLENDSGGGT